MFPVPPKRRLKGGCGCTSNIGRMSKVLTCLDRGGVGKGL